MIIPLKIYARAYGFYLVLSVPLMFMPGIYLYSAVLAFMAGFASLIIFFLIFLALHVAKATFKIAMAVLFFGVLLAVGVAFKLLLTDVFPGEAFSITDADALFPLGGAVAGWVSLWIEAPHIRKHFEKAPQETAESIITHPENQTI